MITREQKSKILERFKIDDERIIVANVLDKVYRYEKTGKIEYTSFLNINEYRIISSILNELKVNYIVFSLDDKLTRKVIFFVPEYINANNEFFSKYITCLKIIPNVKNKLTHKDYMGSIYNLGIKHEVIGDIFATKDCGYLFCQESIASYIITNLYKVGNQEVEVTEIPFYLDEIKSLSLNLEEKEYIVPSLRVDAVLSCVYNLSRNEVKSKIKKGDLFLNDKNEYYISSNLKSGDIVSFRRCGKIKIGRLIRKTRSDRIVLVIYKYS